jgi:serine/threonine protein phosphatase 1
LINVEEGVCGLQDIGATVVKKREFAIADIHGCCRTFRHLLKQIGFSKQDTLYLLGDYIDRGPDSKGVIDLIFELQSDGYHIRPLLGNHEAMLLLAMETGLGEHLSEWLKNGGQATLRSYGVDHPSDIPREHVDFMRSLSLFHCTDTHILVHAGLDFCLEDPFSRKGEQAMLWDRYQSSDMEKQQGRILVVGHTIRHEDEIRRSLKSDIITIDNACYMGTAFEGRGSLAAIELKSGKLFLQRNIEGSY